MEEGEVSDFFSPSWMFSDALLLILHIDFFFKLSLEEMLFNDSLESLLLRTSNFLPTFLPHVESSET